MPSSALLIEGLVSTLDATGRPNLAPMGPRVQIDGSRLVLRPFKTSTTYHNLVHTPEGVFHIIDDALLLARTAIGLPVDAPTRPAELVRGVVITSACRFLEFRITRIDDSSERATFEAEVLAAVTLRDFLGWNRAKHAVLELAILATRAHFLPVAELESEFRRHWSAIEKTGGDDERAAYDCLNDFVMRAIYERRDSDLKL
jgi:hypothetical protein